MGKIADLYAVLHGDGTQLQKDVQREGDKAGQTLGQRIKGQLTRSNVFAGIGAATGVLAIGALKMGEAYDNAFDTIRIGTGATGEAFEGLKKDFTNLMGTVPDDVEVASQVFADLQTRTGLVGEELTGLSKTILDLSRITKTDAVNNVQLATRVFGDWSIATEDQEAALDKLFRASQATGIGVDKLMTQVVQFGAPLRAMGFSMDEAAVMLGKFEKEGVNAELVMGSMRIALGKFAKAGREPKEALQETIAEIQRLGPGAEATALAMETFGARAGADMAAAILEGRFALGELFDTVANGTDTIEGLTDETRDIGDHLKILGNRIGSVIGPMAEGFGDLASTMGPLLYSLPLLTGGIGKLLAAMSFTKVAAFAGAFKTLGVTIAASIAGSGLVSSLSTGIGSLLAKVGLSSVVTGAASALGSSIGALTAAAIPLGLAAAAAAAGVGIALAVKAIFLDPGLQQQTREIGSSLDEQIATGIGDLEQSKAALEKGIARIKALPLGELLYGDQIRDLEAQLAKANTELERQAAQIPETITRAVEGGLTSSQADIARAAGYGFSGITEAADEAVQGATRAGQQVPEGFAQGVISRQGLVDDAMSSLRNLMQNSLGRAQRIARIIGQLTSKELADGLTDRRAAVRKEAERVQAVAEQELAGLIARGGKVGKKAMDELNAGLKSKNPEVRASAKRVKAIVDGTLQEIPPKAKTYGAKTGESYAAGLRSMRVVVKGAAIYLVDGAKEVLRAFSPPGPESPLHDIDKWAKSTGATYADHLADAAPAVAAAARRLVAGAAGEFGGANLQLNPTMGGLAGASAIRLPAEASAARFAGLDAAATGGTSTGGDTFNIPVHVTGVLAARTPDDVARPLRQLASAGVISSAKRRQMVKVPSRA